MAVLIALEEEPMGDWERRCILRHGRPRRCYIEAHDGCVRPQLRVEVLAPVPPSVHGVFRLLPMVECYPLHG